MFTRRPIRDKMLIGAGLLTAIVLGLAATAVWCSYSYRGLARSVSVRANELPLAIDFSLAVTDLRHMLGQSREINHDAFPQSFNPSPERKEGGPIPDFDPSMQREEFAARLMQVEQSLKLYKDQLTQQRESNDALVNDMSDYSYERDTIKEIDDLIAKIQTDANDGDWVLGLIDKTALKRDLDSLHTLAMQLPSNLIQRMQQLKDEAHNQYRAGIVISVTATLVGVTSLGVFMWLCWVWIFYPLRVLMQGSRLVANGNFSHRIHLNTHDEMSVLADAMNAMTQRFEEIRRNLDGQVQERTKQVVRSEQLASVGFLAAGVAHEINNPLASIAFCAESLQSRLAEALPAEGADKASCSVDDVELLRNYLGMIQDEAFRCKEITERLLDYSRLGDVEKVDTDLGDLVRNVIDMVSHLGKYREKKVHFHSRDAAIAPVNPQEMKQVMLNLITNALDSLDPGGEVNVELASLDDDQIVVTVRDNGCGMTEEVKKHLFEPFFTRRRNGQGTGLGLSITYRIIADHGGQIDAHSEGPGCGSEFRITLPASIPGKEQHHRYQAA
ncbi:HAMP domain-containing histidine kinase [Blastopirellula sp. JC732]|uniref:histidine kinase n=1 Tax=Blastopirellula sediminis TaxID=2894196 RepID=A0A9X1MRH6_9BACT|nr:HAMP domain-containing sensor histidine kinase [Blastopirellula sediminis]MCC9605635.1 HAMP domain-containing histidine kinase [Blastopirellula sediminis]MCC9631065.1 HAMP domain-containing histidine kinase [Blastopirellula sediminis]